MRKIIGRRLLLTGLSLIAAAVAVRIAYPPSATPAPAPLPLQPQQARAAPQTDPAPTRPDFSPLKASMQKFIAGQTGMTYGIYFKDLFSGSSFGINDQTLFPAASCIKVPLILYLNELVDNGKLDWQNKVVYSSDLDYQSGAGALQFFAPDGAKYSLRCLSTLTITLSDNISTRMLLRYLGKSNFINFLWSLGAKYVYPNGQNNATPRDMGRYVQAVIDYAAKSTNGRLLLDDMANTIWHVGLPGQLPESITVAHKEGDVTGVADDIGVVYGSRPYILAVMSSGVPNDDVGFGNIASLSKLAYDYEESLAKG